VREKPKNRAHAAAVAVIPGELMDIEVVAMHGLDRETIRRLSRRSDPRGLLQLAAHLALLSATGIWVWITRGSLWLAPAIVLHGVTLNFLFCPLHESVHRTAFASRWINDTVAWICGAVLLLPPEYFRLFHFAHHRFTQDRAQDPELMQADVRSVGSYLWRVSGLPNWYNRLTVTLRHALTGRVAEPYVPESKRVLVVREARILWGCYALLLGISCIFARVDALIYWVLPAIAGQPVLRLFLMAEHSGCDFSDNMFANTRTTYTNRAVQLLAWQMSYHAEHHAFPSVPFHTLARVNELSRDRLAVTAPGYLALHRGLIQKFRKPKPVSNEQAW
jgi:fatty acid desaturase